MFSDRYMKIIVRYLSNECSDEERALVQDMMQTNTDFKVQMQRLQNIWSLHEEEVRVEDMDVEWMKMRQLMHMEAMKDRAGLLQRIGSGLRGWISAATESVPPKFAYRFTVIILLIAGGSYVIFTQKQSLFFHKTQVAQYKTLEVAYGKRMNVSLNDGTRITLDAGSELRYPDVFDKTRKIYLKGEAYFKVSPDEEKPFIVYANQAVVQVLGTQFNIRAWKEAPDVTVTVREGKVRLSSIDNSETNFVYLTQNKQGKVLDSKEVSRPETVDANQYMTWMKNEIFFENNSVKEVLAQLERWYNYTFIFEDSSIINHRIRFHLKQSNVNEVIDMIALITNMSAVQLGDTIRFEHK